MAAVLAALGPAPVAVDAIARATGLTVQSVHIALLELDLAGRIERQGLSLVALKST
jgi:DNA processing protein